MAKTKFIELPGCDLIPILFEDRSVIAIDKPRGWMLVPHPWRQTNWNLQAAIDSSIRANDFWAKSRNLSFLRNVHRLDADTSGVLLFAKSPGAVDTYSDLFEDRRIEKVSRGGRQCAARIGMGLPAPARARPEKVRPNESGFQGGRECETRFRGVAGEWTVHFD